MIYKGVKIPTFELADLVDRVLEILSYKEDDIELIFARDVHTHEIFILKEIREE